MKKFLSILTVLCLVLLMPTAVLADGDRDPGVYTTAPNGYAYTAPQVEDNTQYLYDFAGIIPDDEEPALREKLASTADRRDCALLVVTTDKTDTDPDYGTAVTRAYAEDFYEANAEGLSEDAWILCIDMNNRVIMTVGYGRFAKEKYVAFTEEVYDDVVGFASEGAYRRVVETFASDVYKLDNWSYAMIPTVGSLMISLAAMVVVLVVVLLRHKSASPKVNSRIPVDLVNPKERDQHVRPMGRHVTSHRIEKSSGSSSGGGFSGGMGTSGGGHSTSGGGGHF